MEHGGKRVNEHIKPNGSLPQIWLYMIQHISVRLETAVMGLAAIVTGLLTAISLFNTGYFLSPRPYETTITSERMLLKQGIPTPLFFVASIALIVVLLGVAYLWLINIPSKRIGLFLFVYSVTVCLFWVLSLNATGNKYSYPDSTSLIDSANSLVLGKFGDFAPQGAGHPTFHAYYSWYPFQTGALLWFSLIFVIFGTGNLVAFLIVNAVLVSVSMWSIWKIGQYVGLNEIGQRIAALLLILNVPLITSSGFIYSNAAGLCLALLSVLAAARAIHEQKLSITILWMGISFAIGTFAMIIKGTEILFVLAITCIFFISALRKLMYWLIVLDLLFFAVAHWLTGLSLFFVEHLVNQQFGTGLPQLSWIAIGLTQFSKETAMPGWWNDGAITIYHVTQGDKDLQQHFAKETIKASLSGFFSDPQYAISFFTQKLASEWAEPTYQGLYYSSFAERHSDSTLFTVIMTGDSNRRLIAFENVYQFVLYSSGVAGFISGIAHRKQNANQFETLCLVSLIVLAGFTCFAVWEAKSVYVLPFAAMMILPASYGLQGLQPVLHSQAVHTLKIPRR